MTNGEFERFSIEELITSLRQIGVQEDRMERSKEVEALKGAFYKQLAHLKAEAEAAGEAVEEKFASVEADFKKVYTDFKKERAEYIREQDAQREKNLVAKKAIVEELRALVDGIDNLDAAFPQLRELQTRWKNIGPVPAADFKDLNDTYQFLNERFYDAVKQEHELRDLDFKKNLEAKQVLCEQAEQLAQEEDVRSAFNALQKLHEEWKDLGPVAKEYRESIWERFKLATSKINKRYQEYFENLKASFEDNLHAKELLCEKAEAIAAAQDIKDGSAWASLTKDMEKLQEEWKQIGFAPRKENQKIYERFRAACNHFFERKKEYFSGIKADMKANLAAKEALIAQAEELKDSTAWKETADKLIALQKQWKEIGPVARGKSDDLWKRFRAACDAFFTERDKNGPAENSYRANLKAKKAIIAEISAYTSVSPEADAKAREDFAERFRAIGFVPFKEKDAISKAYKDAMDAAFPRSGRRKEQPSRRSELIKRYNTVKQDIATYENNIGFFSASKNSEALVSKFRERIESAKQELKDIEAQIRNEESEQN